MYIQTFVIPAEHLDVTINNRIKSVITAEFFTPKYLEYPDRMCRLVCEVKE